MLLPHLVEAPHRLGHPCVALLAPLRRRRRGHLGVVRALRLLAQRAVHAPRQAVRLLEAVEAGHHRGRRAERAVRGVLARQVALALGREAALQQTLVTEARGHEARGAQRLRHLAPVVHRL